MMISTVGTSTKLTLVGNETYRLGVKRQTIRVLSGTAWITIDGKDVILSRGQQMALNVRRGDFSVLSGIHGASLEVELKDGYTKRSMSVQSNKTIEMLSWRLINRLKDRRGNIMATLYNSMNQSASLYSLYSVVPQMMSIPHSDMSVTESWQEAAWNAVLPPIKIAETTEGFVFTAALDGVAPQDMRVDLVQGYLSIRASFTTPAPHDGPVSTVEYTREFMIPAQVNEQNARISFHNSMLTVTIPKAQRKLFGLF
jgi:HSP20 family molecular chaperone IbpA